MKETEMKDTRGPKMKIMFPLDQAPDRWSSLHKSGQVSGIWPYSQDLLASAFDVEPIVSSELGAVDLTKTWLRWRFRGPASPEITDVDVVLSWDENLALRAASRIAANCYVNGVIWATDDIRSIKTRIRRLVLKPILQRSNGIFVLSSAQIEPLMKWLQPSNPLVRWIPMGVDSNFYPFYEYPREPFIFSMGTDKHRDPKTLATALAIVLDRNPSIEVLVQTDQPSLFSKGVRTVKRLNGHDVRRNYARASIIAIATHFNIHGSGMTVALESMASGRPVVITGTPGLEDYVQDGVTGYLVSPGDHRGIAESILKLVESPASGQQMGVAGRDAVETVFNVSAMNSSLANFVQDVMEVD